MDILKEAMKMKIGDSFHFAAMVGTRGHYYKNVDATLKRVGVNKWSILDENGRGIPLDEGDAECMAIVRATPQTHPSMRECLAGWSVGYV